MWLPCSSRSTRVGGTASSSSAGPWRRTWRPDTPASKAVPAAPGPRRASVGLVLGAGGMVGLAYNAGALHALHEIGGGGGGGAGLLVRPPARAAHAPVPRRRGAGRGFRGCGHRPARG